MDNINLVETFSEFKEFKNIDREMLMVIIEDIFLSKTYKEGIEILGRHKLVWSPVSTPLEATKDPQAIENDFSVEWDHPDYGKIKVLNNPIKLSETKAEIKCKAPELGEHTDDILKDLGYSAELIDDMKGKGVVG